MNSTAIREDRMVWHGEMAAFLVDDTRLIDLEGAFRSSKTTACLRKVAKACVRHPGMHWWINRYSDGDTQRQLKPQWRAMLQRMGVAPAWNAMEQADILPNGSKVYIFGVKAQDQLARYAKIRGLTLSGIYNDQTEELPKDVFQEFIGRLSQSGYPHQLLLSPNPPDENHWLCAEFPEDNTRPGRKYYSIPIQANAHNLPADTITHLIDAYPPSHPKHRSAVLGKRGLNVIGEPVYKGLFDRRVHVRAMPYDSRAILYESLDFGKHHPCVVWAQRPYDGGLWFLGGLLGQDIFLDDFLPIVQELRAQWFPEIAGLQTCCDPAGSHQNSQGVRDNGVKVLREYGFRPVWQDNANAPDVRGTMIERLGGYMRRRTRSGEAFGIEADPLRWLVVPTGGAPKPWAFLADGFEAGYVWDAHMVSVGSKQVRKAKKDGWYEHGQNCAEYVELNFGAGRKTEAQKVQEAAARVPVTPFRPSSAWS